MPAAVRAYVGLGANLGDAAATLERALDAIAALPGVTLVARSRLYRSAPVGYAAQPSFVNAACALDTDLAPEGLLAGLQAIEARFGRTRSFANAPRTLDLDLLVYGDMIRDDPALTLPHPRLHERGFVLVPLAEIAPEALVPGRGTVRALRAAIAAPDVVPLDPRR